MKTLRQRTLGVLALLASISLASCGELVDPAQLLAPTEASYGKGGSGERLRLASQEEAGIAAPAVQLAVIDSRGGWVGDETFGVEVPARAVRGPTLFAIGASSEYSTSAVIEATATACPTRDTDECLAIERTNDIGSNGFKKPVEIHLSFDPRDYDRGWKGATVVLIQDGELVRVPTRALKKQKKLIGITNHFSLYGIGWP